MNFRSIIICTLLSLLFFNLSFGKNKTEPILNYKKAKNVFVGKIIGIQELDKTLKNDNDYFNVKLAIEFEITKIYKGRRFEKFLIVEIVDVENKDYFTLAKNYLIYAVKNKSKSETYYSSIRTRSISLDKTKIEISEIEGFIKRKLFRRKKDPVPKFKFITGGCNC